MTQRVLVLGAAGMTGLGVLSHLASEGFSVRGTTRALERAPGDLRERFVEFEARTGDLEALLVGYGPNDVIVNCLGLIKHHIRESDPEDRETAVLVNAAFPYRLARLSLEQGFRIIQIVTDCVYSGATGRYTEEDLHDATDVYGQTKSLGEVPSDRVLKLRCSVIGPETSTRVNLLEWVLSHPAGSSFAGYSDHIWNGLTTEAFARIVEGLIVARAHESGTIHIVPADALSKYDLSQLILSAFGRTGVEVIPTLTGNRVDRTLDTLHPEVNAELWRAAGYPGIPTIEEMVRHLAASGGYQPNRERS